MNQLRHNGKFIKRKQLDKKINCGKRFKVDPKVTSNVESHAGSNTAKVENKEFPGEGMRLIDIKYFAKQFFCSNCKKPIQLIEAEAEKMIPMRSHISIYCTESEQVTVVKTAKVHPVNEMALSKPSKRKSSVTFERDDTTTKAILGTIHSGLGLTDLNRLLACLNIPTISSTLFKRYEREVGPVIEELAKKSCKEAAQEERELVISKTTELCDQIPDEIASEIKKQLSPFKNHLGSMNMRHFDQAVGNIVYIIVCYNMGWSKRGNGRTYDSHNGYGAMIGFLSGKVLDYMTKNRLCRFCDNNVLTDHHDCRKNHVGSSKIMEAHVGEELINQSEVLKETGLRVIAMVGDEGSTTIKHVGQNRTDTVHKLSDKVHLKKNISKQLYSLREKFKELKPKNVIPHIKKLYNYAVSQNKKKSTELASIFRSIPDHLYNHHENCSLWCKKADEQHVVILQDFQLWSKLKEIFEVYAQNSAKISVAASTQANEALNHTFTQKAPKNKFYSSSESADYRIASGVLGKNKGEVSILDVKKKLNLSPGLYTSKYVQNSDQTKRKIIDKSKLAVSKAQRNILAATREKVRSRNEKHEGTQYESGCGLLLDLDNTKNSIDKIGAFEKSLNTQFYPWRKDFRIVYFDIETSSLRNDADILQIAAKSGDNSISIYINPCQPIDYEASQVTGLKNINGTLFLHGRTLITVPMVEALQAFIRFLRQCNQPCLLVAHNSKFDVPRLLNSLKNYHMLSRFKKYVYGFSDSLAMLKQVLVGRKGPGKFKLDNLSKELLKIDNRYYDTFHEALFDVTVLEALCSVFIPISVFETNVKTVPDAYASLKQSKSRAINRPLLLPLKGVLSNEMLDKLASKNITFDFLEKLFKKGEVLLVNYLSEKVDKKARVTSNRKILAKIANFFREKIISKKNND